MTNSNPTGNVATHMLSFMIRGVFNNKEHIVAHYPTDGVCSDQLYPMVWSVVKALERIGFKV
jgi:hypothetical protein